MVRVAILIGWVLFGAAQAEAAVDSLEAAVQVRPMGRYREDVRFIPLAAQAYAARGQAERALALFDAYFDLVPEEEQALYEDLSLVALEAELKAYRAAGPEGRAAFLERFWKKRDPTLVSGGAGRRAEHSRRVWYARTYFSEAVQPWDRRGEVYIRYGEPDYRSRSDRVNPPPDEAVAAVKEAQTAQIYTDKWKQQALPVPPEAGGSGAAPVGPVYPVDRFQNLDDPLPPGTEYMKRFFDRLNDPLEGGAARVPWESWVYLNVGGGVEFMFTDQAVNGAWDFAPFPKLPVGTPAGLISQVTRFMPAAVLARVAAKTPDYYGLPPGVEPLAFYYDLATFRDRPDVTELEVYFGIPLDQVEGDTTGGQRVCRVQWRVALADSSGEVVYRGWDELVFAGQERPEAGMFVPEATAVRAPPGAYRLAVQVADLNSGRWGVYQQEVTAPAYADSFAMSDLELAWGIVKTRQPEKFRKGEVWVIPMPSRSYRKGRPVFVYYEVYNFQKDRLPARCQDSVGSAARLALPVRTVTSLRHPRRQDRSGCVI